MKRGFSLIELIVALGLISVAVLLLGVAVSSVPLTKNTRDQNLAYHIAVKKIEELRSISYASLPGSGTFTDPGFAELNSAAGQLTVASYQGSSEIKHITVTVTWTDGGANKNVTLDTLMAENGLNE